MVRIKLEDLCKAIDLLKKDSMSDIISVKEDGAILKLITTDKTHKDLILELSDTQYPRSPRVTRTDTF